MRVTPISAPFVPDERGANAVSGVCPGRSGAHQYTPSTTIQIHYEFHPTTPDIFTFRAA